MRWILTGGTGMIGRALSSSLIQDGHEVIVLTRKPSARASDPNARPRLVQWDGVSPNGWAHWVDGADAVVNMAGERIAGPNPFTLRWSRARKQRICESRTHAGEAVTQAIRVAKRKPGVVIQFSGVDYYPPTNEPTTEKSPAGDGFLAHVCAQCWEPSTEGLEAMGVRRVITRIGPVLHPDDGALPPLVLQTRLFLGGPLGSGRQYFSWIHISDVVGAIRFLVDGPEARGVYNLTAPNPVTNGEFVRTLGRVMGRPSFLPVPAIALKFLFGEMASTLLQGPRAVPERLLAAGYVFRFAEAETALKDLL